MKKVYFRILAICLSLFLTFSILYRDYIEAEALEWVGVAVGYDTAFKFLLGLLGVSVGVGVAEEIDWGTLRENAIQVQLDQGNSQAEVSAWWSNVIHGSLDTASSCWTSFKDWVSSEISTSSEGSGVVSYGSISDVVSSVVPNVYGLNNYNYNIGCGYYNLVSSVYYFTLFSTDFKVNSVIHSGNYVGISLSASQSSYYTTIQVNANNGNVISQNNFSSTSYGGSITKNVNTFFLNSGYTETELQNIYSYFHLWGLDIANDNLLDSAYGNIGDIALNPENADTLGVDVIPLPWENIGVSDESIENIIDDAIERVIDGTMSLENYWEYVQNITNTYAYSIENNFLLPNENGEDKKADDKVKENTENGAFVLYGLEKVFPFCIPFDIYAFITLLKADPVAPVIEYPIYNPVTQENEIITIDFSEWESVVIIFRYIFDFLLIIGLLLLARPLVGAGGDS